MRLLRSLIASIMALSIGGCSFFQDQRAPFAREQRRARPSQPATVTTLPSTPLRSSTPPRSAPVPISRPPQPEQRLVPAPTVTLDNSDADKADAQRLLEQARGRLAHVNRASLASNTASIYQQANDLINVAERAVTVRASMA